MKEQRVHRALWRLVLYFDLVSISKPSQGEVNDVWALLRSQEPHGAWPRLLRRELKEMHRVYNFLRDLSNITFPPPEHGWQLSQFPATELESLTAPQFTPIQDYTLREWHQSIPDVNRRNDAASFFDSAQVIFHSRLYRSSIEPFRRFRFVIRDLDKMGRLGLADLSPVHLPPWDSQI